MRDNVVALFGIAGAIAAIAAAWFAYVQIKDANQARNAQESASVSAQARLISAGFIPGYDGSLSEGPNGQTITQIGLYNDSLTPVYHVIVSLVLVQGAGPQTGLQLSKAYVGANDPYQVDLLELPPGHYKAVVSGGWAGMMAAPGVELAYKDANGRNWVRYASGRIIQIHQAPEAYYGLDEPVGWEAPQKAG